MDRELLKSAEKYRKKRYKKKTWKKVVSVLGCMVVFCVTYALVLPAITQEEETFCGMDEHRHEDSCYVRLSDTVVEETLICPILTEPAHVHDPSCYELQGGHTHGEDCVLREIGQLTCTLAEEEGHIHDDACYSLKPLLCMAQENHLHSDACYQLNELHCTVPEGHLHGEDCFLPGELLCDLPVGHVHAEGCFLPGELVCTAAEGHSHTEQCLADGVLTCTEPENHLHGGDCYAPPTLICTEPENHIHGSVCHAEPTLICDQPEQHTHGLACCDAPVLICTEPERHTHGLDCYQDPSLACEQQEHHIHDDSCCAEMVQVCTDREAHRHSDACYVEHTLFCPVADSQPELCDCDILWMPVCAQEEGHVHDLNCYIRTLTCRETQRSGHRHGELCHVVTETMICTLEEAPGEPVLICTLPEAEAEQPSHVHDETCYAVAENPLTCSLPEDEEHQHGPRCYGVWSLLCEIEEHTHDLTCRADLSADWETAADWESSFAYVPLSGVPAEDVVAIAQSQLGYSESQKNYIVPEGTTETKGYTRYGDWYGDPYGDWCGMFASFCLHYAEVDPAFPLESNCRQWRSALKEQGLYREAGEYLPVPGDLVFFARNGSATLDHVGIVTAYDPDAQQITTVEGNKYNTVAGDSYFIHDAQIAGYGLVSGEPADESIVLSEQTLEALIYTDGTYLQPAEDSTVITVSGMLPEGAQARAYPVTLETDLIDGQTVIMAYDISIFYGEEQLYEQADTPLSVTFRPADWEAPPEDADYTIYYIPEEGEPEPVETVVDEQAVNFLTDHFSTYAMTSGGTASTVFLNGASGNDSKSGTSTGNAVKTIEKAMSLVKDGGTIYISDTVTVTDRQEWDVNNKVTIQRYSDRYGSFTGPLIVVSKGGELELRNITINGGSGKPAATEPDFSVDISEITPNIGTNTTYASGSAKAPLIVVNDGGRLTLEDGATLTNNSNKPNTYSSSGNSYFKENGYVGLGGAIYCNGTLTMNGGLIQYCEALCGGGVYLENGSFYLNDGTIDHNYARDIEEAGSKQYHKNAGGGVYVGENSTMTMTGGTISYNQSSREGGGISLGWLNRNKGAYFTSYVSTFTMNGGTITHNTATSTGGGLNVTAGYQAFINAGTFTHNVAYGKEYQPGDNESYWYVYSGGAIYIDASGWDIYGRHAGVPGKVVLNRALITKNKASSGGGGVASCDTSTNYVYGTATNGTAIYDNYLHKKSTSNELYIAQTGKITVSDKLLGDGNYGWTKSSTSSYGYTYIIYKNNLDESSSAIQTARALATVFITDNYGYLGGGIGCNGLVEIGGEDQESTYINIIKKWEDTNAAAHPDYIEVRILQDGKPYGEPIRIYRTFDEDGNEVWPTFYVGGLPKGHEYTVQELEVPGYEALIKKDGKGQDFIITNTPTGYWVTKQWLDEDGKTPLTSGIPPGPITVRLYQNDVPYGKPIELSAANNWVYRWQDLPEKDDSGNDFDYRVEELKVPDGFYSKVEKSGKAHTITNIKSPVTVLSVEKQWDGVTPAESVQIQLYQNGVAYRELITLKQKDNWFHKWEDLPTKTTTGADAEYTVKEILPSGKNYTSTVAKTYWTKVTSLSQNENYIFVNSQGEALAGSGTSNLTWVNAEDALTKGTPLEDAALWSYSNNRLSCTVNNTKKHLKFNSSKYSKYFSIDNSGSDIAFSDGKLSCLTYTSSGWTTYYLTDIGSNGYGSASTSSGSAMTFTAYKRRENPHFIVTNSAPTKMEVPFAKYSTGTDSSGNPTLLAGAELALYLADDTAAKKIPGTEVTGVLVSQWESQTGTSDNPNGTKTICLTDGTYYLVETKAPPGHMGLSGPIVFEVDVQNGQILLTKCPDRPEYPEAGQPVEVIKVYNSAMVTLPETGGVGAAPYRLLGVGMMLAAVLMLYGGRKPRRRGRRADGS